MSRYRLIRYPQINKTQLFDLVPATRTKYERPCQPSRPQVDRGSAELTALVDESDSESSTAAHVCR